MTVANPTVVRRKRKYDLSFEQGTKWVDVPQKVRFAADSASAGSSSGSAEDSLQRQGHDSTGSHEKPVVNHTSRSREGQQEVHRASARLPIFSNIGNYTTTKPVLHQGLDSPLGWHIHDYNEALLFRYYVTDLAAWFDETDTQKHFTFAIPQLAQGCASLMNAILAFSAKHLSLQGKLPEAVSLHYTDACYKLLLPRLQEKAFAASGLAAVLLLRTVQHMTDSVSSDIGVGDFFLGLNVNLDALRANLDSNVHAAIFANVLRFYTHLALSNDKPLDLMDSNCEWLCHELPMPEDSRKWEWCALMECCRAVNFVYGPKLKTMERWMSGEASLSIFRLSRPPLLDPIYAEKDTEGEPFPRTIFASEIHVASSIYYSLTTLLLINNIPDCDSSHYNIPTPEEIEHQSYSSLRRVCGTATYHINSVPTLIKTSSVICYAGHLLKTEAEQNAAYELLMKAESHFPGTQPKAKIERLRASWGWTD
ncbi:uncharacterized protein LTR77_002325 [Saxophila tyrrhenica]|uniref:Uncharacterized protein n=1 Tax=Saxophila tyrrhenica TaxID=1690608 RepID=A0AAV9PIV5_9PEZI|nr:hypothetical protein LTR77_002325 [Saxophila tyrrhenica]